VARLTDPSVVVPAGRAAAFLGPANLAFTDPARFAGPGASPRPATEQMPVTDQRVQRLLLSVSAEDAAETDLARMDSAVHVVLDGDRVVAAAGYLTWPGKVAHLSVLTGTACRGRGLAKLAGAAATADALARGLLPQWRARVPASIRAAASLGFVSCGSQLCIRLACPDADQG
jgi:hypothetical protein